MIRFGLEQTADCQAGRIVVVNNRRLQFKLRGYTFKINSPGKHNVYNALAAISCGRLYKIRYNDINKAFSRFQFRDARQEIIKNGRFWLIDDTYNANPLSLKSALDTLDSLTVKGKRILVCADMLELGWQSKPLHQSAGRMIARSRADIVLTIGRQAKYITQSVNCLKGRIRAFHCDDLKGVHRRLNRMYCPGDAILVKGSRSMHMERTVAFLKTHFK
jgi:UDP-N-acetylmuramoyl-tripeptide--D-alanyl-D-alanine ligase